MKLYANRFLRTDAPARRRALWGGLALTILASLLLAGTLFAKEGDDDQEDRGEGKGYAIGLWGDLPYSTVQQGGVLNLIDDMNAQKLAFTVHDGDLKSGSSACVMETYTNALNYFNALRAPAAFTPGDNDWTDCDRVPGYPPLVQLDLERSLFFNTPFTLGQKKLKQDVQATPKCLGASGEVPCVENRRWTYNRVTYVTLNVQGSCNNLCPKTGYTPALQQEFDLRNAANIAWMKAAFAEAKAKNSAAVMFISQADPGFDSHSWDAPNRDPKTLIENDGARDGFVEFLTALRTEVIAFKKPVAYVHGDSHYFRVDRPFLSSTGYRLENFTRVETFGDNQEQGTNDVNWVKVLVDPNSREVFAYQAQVVPKNRVAVPAP